MKKIITLLVLAVALSLAGCGKNKAVQDMNEGVGKSTATPTLDMPKKGKYKF